jgi:cephalosporin hydroxylase
MNNIISPTWPIPQKKYEILALQELLKNEKISRILEIGTWSGGTALLWAQIVSKWDDGIVYCCDLSFNYGVFDDTFTEIKYGPKQMYASTQWEKYIKELQGDSHDPVFVERVKREIDTPVDMLFIDGDHSYEGVKADFENFSLLVRPGGYVVFHDIIDKAESPRDPHRPDTCVSILWNELKKYFQWWEFIDNNEYYCYKTLMPSICMGIGVIKIK